MRAAKAGFIRKAYYAKIVKIPMDGHFAAHMVKINLA